MPRFTIIARVTLHDDDYSQPDSQAELDIEAPTQFAAIEQFAGECHEQVPETAYVVIYAALSETPPDPANEAIAMSMGLLKRTGWPPEMEELAARSARIQHQRLAGHQPAESISEAELQKLAEFAAKSWYARKKGSHP